MPIVDNETAGRFGGAYWDDLRAPAAGINPPGAASDPGRDPSSGWFLFSPTAVELIYVTFQMPHGWVEGDPEGISPHVHWHKSTSAAGAVAWRLRYKWANIGGDWSDWSAAETVTTPSVSDANTAGRHALTGFTNLILPTGKISMVVLCEIARVGSDAADTYAADAVLTDVDCHIRVNQPGSVQEFVKFHNSFFASK